MNHLWHFERWSNFFFGIPLVLALLAGVYWYACLVFVVMTISFIYHYLSDTRLYILDVILANTLILYNCVLVYEGGFSEPYFMITCVLVIASALCFWWANANEKTHIYKLYHGLFHVVSVAICVASLFTYLAGRGLA